MATLLTTRKMSPALAARVNASVSGRRAATRATGPRRFIALGRAFALVGALGLTAWVLLSIRRAETELEAKRAHLLERTRRESASLTPAEKLLVSRVESRLGQCAGTYAGDWVADELRGVAFRAILERPSVYIRGPLASFTTREGIAESAAASFKDAFVLCLLDPPASRTEKALLAKARAAHAGGERMAAAERVERLYPALRALPLLAPSWQAEIAATKTERALDKMETAFLRAPLEAAKRAARAKLLLFVMDEPGAASGPTELDGERAHHVRLGLWDMAADKLLLRLRRHVDPSWISPIPRAEYATGIDACALAHDVRTELDGARVEALIESATELPPSQDARRETHKAARQEQRPASL